MSAFFSDAKRITAIGFLALAVGFSSYYFFGSNHKSSALPDVVAPTTTTQPKLSYAATSDLTSKDVNVLVAVIETRNSVFMNSPDPTALDSFLSSTADDYKDEKTLLTNLHANKQHVDKPLLDVKGIQIANHQSVFVTAFIVASSPGSQVANSNGTTAYTLNGSSPDHGYQMSFVKTVSGWKIASILDVPMPAAQMKSIVESGKS